MSLAQKTQYGKSSFAPVALIPPGNFVEMPLARPSLCLLTSFGLLSLAPVARALPPPEEIPEERLRTEIILEARSPLDGQPLSPAEYEELLAAIVDRPAPTLSPQLRETIFLLQLRRVLRPVLPLLP